LGHFDFLVRYLEFSASTPMQAGDGSFESSDHKVLTEHIKEARRVFLINLQAKQRPAQAAPLLGPLTPTTLAPSLAGTCKLWLCQNTVLKPPNCIHICKASTHKVWSPKTEFLRGGGGPGACLPFWMMLSGTFCCPPPPVLPTTSTPPNTYLHICPAGPSGRLADKFKGLGPDGLVSPGTIINNGDVTINMQVGLFFVWGSGSVWGEGGVGAGVCWMCG
jgi:hypothetical protein